MTKTHSFHAVLLIDKDDDENTPPPSFEEIRRYFELRDIPVGIPWTSDSPIVLKFRLPR